MQQPVNSMPCLRWVRLLYSLTECCSPTTIQTVLIATHDVPYLACLIFLHGCGSLATPNASTPPRDSGHLPVRGRGAEAVRLISAKNGGGKLPGSHGGTLFFCCTGLPRVYTTQMAVLPLWS